VEFKFSQRHVVVKLSQVEPNGIIKGRVGDYTIR